MAALKHSQTWQVVAYKANGAFASAIAGLGRNAGTWDTAHTKSVARNLACKLNADPARVFRYKAEEIL